MAMTVKKAEKLRTRAAQMAVSLIGDPTRIALLELLREGPASVSNIVKRLKKPQPQISHHLMILKSTGCVEAERQGKCVVYSLVVPDKEISEILDAHIALLGSLTGPGGPTGSKAPSHSGIKLTTVNFDEQVIESRKPALVLFWAEWCMPCKMFSPTLKDLADEYGDRLVIGHLDIDAYRDPSVRYSISAIPTVILFKGGKVFRKFVGLHLKKDFQEAIDDALSVK